MEQSEGSSASRREVLATEEIRDLIAAYIDHIRARTLRQGRLRRRRRQTRERRPARYVPSFFEVSLSMGNFLSVSGRLGHDPDLVEAVGHYLIANPITPGYDIDAYWSGFAVWANR